MDDHAALQIPHDREISPVCLSVTNMNLINSDRLNGRCVNCCKSLLKIPFLEVYYCVPSKVIMFCPRPDAALFQKSKNHPLKHDAETGFRMRKK